MSIDKIRELGPEELMKQLEETRRELFNLRFQAATRQLADNSQLRKVRRRIARMLTVIRQRDSSAGAKSR